MFMLAWNNNGEKNMFFPVPAPLNYLIAVGTLSTHICEVGGFIYSAQKQHQK